MEGVNIMLTMAPGGGNRYFPLGFALLGWPYLGAAVLDGWI
jgi:hypothetical protein